MEKKKKSFSLPDIKMSKIISVKCSVNLQSHSPLIHHVFILKQASFTMAYEIEWAIWALLVMQIVATH